MGCVNSTPSPVGAKPQNTVRPETQQQQQTPSVEQDKLQQIENDKQELGENSPSEKPEGHDTDTQAKNGGVPGGYTEQDNKKESTLTNDNIEITIQDSGTVAKAEEEPKEPLPEEDFGDLKLGLQPEKDKISELLSELPEGELFCDHEFPADDDALYYSSKREDGKVVWMRPKDLVDTPHLLVDGISQDDIKQGLLGDCWFLSGCAAVCRQEKFMKKIIPEDQPLYGEGYRGLVHFSFWRVGKWIDVYIDDRLPTIDGRLLYARSSEKTEFWVPLLEKAYAKLHGSYEAIEGGQTMDALVDLTGGLAERYELKDTDLKLYKKMVRAHKADAFIACSRRGNWRDAGTAGKADANGLVSGHAYTVTNLAVLKHKMGRDRLVQIRNPWGKDSSEWKGSWSDNDRNWKWVSKEQLQEIGQTKEADGEFWMSYKDFCKEFSEVTICTLGPDFDGDGVTDDAGHVALVSGEWIKGKNAGGCRNNLDKFSTNPQFVLSLTHPDDFEPETGDPENEGKCCIVIGLMQEHRRSKRNMGVKKMQIGFVIYKTDDPTKRLPKRHFMYNYDSGSTGVYINFREVSATFDLDPGHYVLIPSTFNPGDNGTFIIRAYAQKKFELTGPLE